MLELPAVFRTWQLADVDHFSRASQSLEHGFSCLQLQRLWKFELRVFGCDGGPPSTLTSPASENYRRRIREGDASAELGKRTLMDDDEAPPEKKTLQGSEENRIRTIHMDESVEIFGNKVSRVEEQVRHSVEQWRGDLQQLSSVEW